MITAVGDGHTTCKSYCQWHLAVEKVYDTDIVMVSFHKMSFQPNPVNGNQSIEAESMLYLY